MKTIKLITCNDAVQAHIIQGALANEGIDSLLHNENMSTLLRGYVRDISGVDVLVADCDYEAAMRLLQQNQMIPEEQKFCPFCGSDQIRFVLKKEHRMKAISAAIASMLAGVPPGDNHWEYICSHCGKAFEKPVAEFNPVVPEVGD